MGYVDLHCHWVPGVDDGVKTPADGVALLRALRDAGFTTAVATPHMRPGMFDNTAAGLRAAFDAFVATLPADVPEVHLGSEHWLDDVVFRRLVEGEGLPYPGGRAVLVEFNPQAFPLRLPDRIYDLRRRKLVPVIAHPERYRPVWDDADVLEPLLDAGACLLLDVCSLVGKYGRAPQRAAEKLLEEDAYEAACTDAHRPEDVVEVTQSIARLAKLVGPEERDRLLDAGPRGILRGEVG